jgi:hypothetical protein
MLNSCRPDWWGNCSTDGIAGAALSVVTMSAPFPLKTDVTTGDGAGLSCFGRNSLFAAVGFVMLCATRSLQVLSNKASDAHVCLLTPSCSGECRSVADADGCPACSHASCCRRQQSKKEARVHQDRLRSSGCREEACQKCEENGHCCARLVASPPPLQYFGVKEHAYVESIPVTSCAWRLLPQK